MRIDWRALGGAGVDGFDLIPTPEGVDWADPTHVPLMVDQAVAGLGNSAEFLDDAEFRELCVMAIDAMPGGRPAVQSALEPRVREMFAAHEASDWLYDPATPGKYPWE